MIPGWQRREILLTASDGARRLGSKKGELEDSTVRIKRLIPLEIELMSDSDSPFSLGSSLGIM